MKPLSAENSVMLLAGGQVGFQLTLLQTRGQIMLTALLFAHPDFVNQDKKPTFFSPNSTKSMELDKSNKSTRDKS